MRDEDGERDGDGEGEEGGCGQSTACQLKYSIIGLGS